MIDAFFWYTGLVFWILVAAAAACIVAADANDRGVRRLVDAGLEATSKKNRK